MSETLGTRPMTAGVLRDLIRPGCRAIECDVLRDICNAASPSAIILGKMPGGPDGHCLRVSASVSLRTDEADYKAKFGPLVERLKSDIVSQVHDARLDAQGGAVFIPWMPEFVVYANYDDDRELLLSIKADIGFSSPISGATLADLRRLTNDNRQAIGAILTGAQEGAP